MRARPVDRHALRQSAGGARDRGLADTVHDGVTGFAFHDFTTDACWAALARAVTPYHDDPAAWTRMQQAAMAADFSWTPSAQGYQQLFEWAIARVRGY